ncbi:MAG: hypothetical protein KC978_03385 [Candidatus Omnitrophica bacterium]|nr:hypothetical protein [Candidatus Omnitrophota bacterium]
MRVVGLLLLSLLAWISPIYAEVTMENVEYGGWANCVRLSNGTMELIATTDVGPRIIRCGFVGGENLFLESTDQLGKTGGEDWRIYGGHRLWHAPEMKPRTYAPDNEPVKLGWDGERLILTQPREEWTAVQKEIEVRMAEDRDGARVLHRITNKNLWPIRLSPWAITVFRGGGFAVLPRAVYGKHGENLLPTQNLSLWPYTNMADPRFTWGDRFIRVRTDAESKDPQKIGILNTRGWGAYVLGNEAFLKQIEYEKGAPYPDLNSSTEVYTQGMMLELETLGPLTEVEPGQSVEWIEHWTLLKGDIAEDDSSIESFFAPHLLTKEATPK